MEFMQLPIGKKSTVKGVIKKIIEAYLKNDKLDDSKLQYPD